MLSPIFNWLRNIYSRVVNDELHPQFIPAPQPEMGFCGRKASSAAQYSDWSIDCMGGQYTLQNSLSMDKQAIEFYKRFTRATLMDPGNLLSHQ